MAAPLSLFLGFSPSGVESTRVDRAAQYVKSIVPTDQPLIQLPPDMYITVCYSCVRERLNTYSLAPECDKAFSPRFYYFNFKS